MAWWDNDPVADAGASSGPVRINIGKQPTDTSDTAFFASDPIADMIKNDARGTEPVSATAPVSTAQDIGLSAAGAPQEALVRAAGAPAAISELAGNALTYPVEKVAGAFSPDFTAAVARQRAADPTAGRSPLPDTAFFKRHMDAAINALTGADSSIFYTPQTEPGRLTQEGLVGGITGAATGNPLTALSGLSGGVSGEASRKVFEGTPLEAPASIVGSVVGGGIPFAAQSATNWFRPEAVAARNMQSVTSLPAAQQQAVIDHAANISQKAADMGVKLLPTETIQQALEELGLGGSNRLGGLQRAVEESAGGEGLVAPLMAQRAGAVRAAGEGLLTDTFGQPVDPARATGAVQDSAEGLLTSAVRARTDATQPSFAQARTQSASGIEQPLQALRDKVDAEIKLTGADNALGQKLQKFRSLLDQTTPGEAKAPSYAIRPSGYPDGSWQAFDAEGNVLRGDIKYGDSAPRFKTQQQAQAFAEKNLPAVAGPTALGPLVETNRTYAENLYKKYNPLDPTNTFNNREVAAIAPFNKELQGILEQASPAYKTGLTTYAAQSKNVVNPLEQGSVGRLANAPGEETVRAMSNEFLDPKVTSPGQVKQLLNDLGSQNPQAVPDLVNTRLRQVLDDSTKRQQNGPNPWGGAGFVRSVLGSDDQSKLLQTIVESQPKGAEKWAGIQNFAQVMRATGKRLASGPATQQKLEMAQELREGVGGLTDLANADATAPLKMFKGWLENKAAQTNSEQLAKIMTGPDAEQRLYELAKLDPQSRRAQVLTGELLALAQGIQRTGDAAPQGEGLLSVAAAEPAPQALLKMPEAQTGLLPAPSGYGKPPVSSKPEDRDALIRTVYGEAIGEGAKGQAAVAHVILNRLKAGQGSTIQQVVQAKNQFEPWSTAEGRQKMQNMTPEEYQKIADVVDPILAGTAKDPTGNATSFLAPTRQAKEGRSMPAWTQKLKKTVRIGNHDFYR